MCFFVIFLMCMYTEDPSCKTVYLRKNSFILLMKLLRNISYILIHNYTCRCIFIQNWNTLENLQMLVNCLHRYPKQFQSLFLFPVICKSVNSKSLLVIFLPSIPEKKDLDYRKQNRNLCRQKIFVYVFTPNNPVCSLLRTDNVMCHFCHVL